MREFFTQRELYVSIAIAAVISKFTLPPLMRQAEESGKRARERFEEEDRKRREEKERKGREKGEDD